MWLMALWRDPDLGEPFVSWSCSKGPLDFEWIISSCREIHHHVAVRDDVILLHGWNQVFCQHPELGVSNKNGSPKLRWFNPVTINRIKELLRMLQMGRKLCVTHQAGGIKTGLPLPDLSFVHWNLVLHVEVFSESLQVKKSQIILAFKIKMSDMNPPVVRMRVYQEIPLIPGFCSKLEDKSSSNSPVKPKQAWTIPKTWLTIERHDVISSRVMEVESHTSCWRRR